MIASSVFTLRQRCYKNKLHVIPFQTINHFSVNLPFGVYSRVSILKSERLIIFELFVEAKGLIPS